MGQERAYGKVATLFDNLNLGVRIMKVLVKANYDGVYGYVHYLNGYPKVDEHISGLVGNSLLLRSLLRGDTRDHSYRMEWQIPAKYWLTLNQAIHFFGYDSNEFTGSQWRNTASYIRRSSQ